MDNAKLQKMLHQLHKELGEFKPVDDKTQELLHQVMEDIQAVISASPEEQHEYQQSLLVKLKEVADHFEEAHLGLTEAIGRIITVLNGIGI